MQDSVPAAAPIGPVSIHPKEHLVLRISTAFWWTVLAAPPTTILTAVATRGFLWPMLAACLALIVGASAGWAFGAARARHYRVQHLADGLLVQRGVIWQSETFVPRSRIQHTDVNQGPLDRRWGMAKLSLHTAGTRLENISIGGLRRNDALALRDTLLDRREGIDGA